MTEKEKQAEWGEEWLVRRPYLLSSTKRGSTVGMEKLPKVDENQKEREWCHKYIITHTTADPNLEMRSGRI